MPRPRNAAETARWERLKILIDALTKAQVADTPESRAVATRIRYDIAAVFRAAGFHYPVGPPADRGIEERAAILRVLIEKLRPETESLTDMATSGTERARLNMRESSEAVRSARAIRARTKR
jgi:hypothetical protein